MKECPEGKVLNPKSNRCVSITGAIGKKILAEVSKKDISIKTNNSIKKKQNIIQYINKVVSINNSDLFSTIANRLTIDKIINDKLNENNLIRGSEKCLDRDLIKYIDIDKVLGYGSFGVVSLIKLKDSDIKIALKETKIHSIRKKILTEVLEVSEVRFLITEINKIIEKKISANFPYTYSYFMCNTCNIILGKTKLKNIKCALLLSEFASGDLYNFDKKIDNTGNISVDEILFNVYFQIMYAISVLHKYTGIIHNDIKLENILYYKIIPGGFWKYIIGNSTYYLPNLGFVFILNDYGVSYNVFPIKNLKNYNLLSFGNIEDNKFKQTINSILCKNNIKKCTFLQYKKYVKNFNIDIKDITPENYISVFQTYDIMDCIYMFSSGKRTTQGDMKGMHHGMIIFDKSIHFKNTIYKLLGITKKTDIAGNWEKNDHYVWQRVKYGKLRDSENPLYMSAIHNLQCIYKNKYNVVPEINHILETYTF